MIKKWMHASIGVMLLLFGFQAQAQLKLQEIIDRHAEAMGGKENWARIQTMRIVHTDANGRRSTELFKAPDKYQIVFELESGQQFLKSYDGQEGWICRKGKYESMDAGEVIEMAEEPEFFTELMFAKERKHKLKLLEPQLFEGRSAWTISLEKNKGDIQTYLVDSQTYLILAVSEYSHDSKWKGTSFQTIFEDYAPVEGLQFARKFGIKIGADKPPLWFDLHGIELNPVLLDGAFSKLDTADLQQQNAVAIVAAMHAAASRASLSEYTFVQQTVRYDSSGQALPASTWYEALQYPDLFRIDVGEPGAGRAVIYRNDSAYFFREGKLARSTADPMPFMLLEGGLKCYPFDVVLVKMKDMGYDLNHWHMAEFQGKTMYVIGADAGDLVHKQIWIERDRLIPIRRIDPQDDGGLLEAVYGGFQMLEGKWVETEVEFRMNGVLLQREIYTKLDGQPHLQASLFIPQQFGQWHWRK